MTRFARAVGAPAPSCPRARLARASRRTRPIALAARLSCGALLAGSGWLTNASAQMAAPAAPAPQTEQAEQATVMQKVTVTAKRARADDLPATQAGGLAASGARMGLLGNQDLMDTPFNISGYTAELIESLQARTVADVLNNDPSVRFTTSGTHAYENFRLRGFDVHGSDLAINGLYGLAPLGSTTLEFVERVEVLKGPSAMFTGMSPSGGIGGVVNLVPKRAGEDPLTRLTLGYQSERQLGAHLDVGRRFGAEKAVGLRVNAAWSDGRTDLQGQDKRQHLLAAALDYRTDALNASLDVYDAKLDFDGGSAAMYGFASPDLAKAPDPSVNFLRGAAGEQTSRAALAHAEYAFTRSASVFASLGAREHELAGFLNGTHAHSVQPDGSARVRGVAQRGYEDSSSAELGARVNLDALGVRHELVLQATQLKLESGLHTNVTGMQASNIYHPIVPTMPAMPTGTIPKTGETSLSGLALVDTLSFMKDALRLTLGLRQQRVEQSGFAASGVRTSRYDEQALTPALGLVVKPWGESLSLYANFVQGLSQGNTVGDLDATNYGHVFKPYKTEQRELGVKWKAGDFMNTVALFQIDKPTMMRTGADDHPTYTDGANTRVRGLEWNTSGVLTPTLRVLGGLAYADSELTKTQGGVNQGKAVSGVPRWQGNLGAHWDTPLPGLSLNARVSATSRMFLDSANIYRLPGWGQLDLGASYTTRVAARPWTLRLNVDNALDRHYYSGSFAEPRATLAAGRTVRASLSVDF